MIGRLHKYHFYELWSSDLHLKIIKITLSCLFSGGGTGGIQNEYTYYDITYILWIYYNVKPILLKLSIW